MVPVRADYEAAVGGRVRADGTFIETDEVGDTARRRRGRFANHLGGYDFVFERNLVREARLIGVAIKQNHGLKKQISSCTISTYS